MTIARIVCLTVPFFAATIASADPLLDLPEAATFEAPATVVETPVAVVEPAEQSVADAMTEMADADPNIEVTNNADGDVVGMVMLSDILFGYDQSDLTPEAIAVLRAVSDKLKGSEGLELVGHTDSIGSSSFNAGLGLARAEAVRDWLVTEGGMSPEGISAASAGEDEPIAANRTDDGQDNPEGRALNRRVEFRIVEPDVAEVKTEELAALADDAPAAGPTVQ